MYRDASIFSKMQLVAMEIVTQMRPVNEKKVFVNTMAVRVDRYGRKITGSRRLHKVIETARARRLLPKHNEKIRGSPRNAFAYHSASD